jgi:hypothetical protein
MWDLPASLHLILTFSLREEELALSHGNAVTEVLAFTSLSLRERAGVRVRFELVRVFI